MKLAYYIKNYLYNQLPQAFFKRKYKTLQAQLTVAEKNAIKQRVNYYCKLSQPVQLLKSAQQIRNFSFQKPSAYYFDLKQYLHWLGLQAF